MSKQNSREEMREAIKSVAEKTQYVRENLHKPFNGSTKFVTIATVTGLLKRRYGPKIYKNLR